MDGKPMICLLNDSFPPLIDGVANAVANYAGHISADSGLKAMVVTPSHPQANDAACPYPVIRYPSIDLRRKTGYMAGIPFSPELTRRLSKEKVMVLHSHCPVVSTLLGRKLRSSVDAPLVLTYHTKYDIDIAQMTRNKALQSGSKKALLNNINACDEVWTVSRGAGENLRALGFEGEYIVMPNGVDLPCQRASQRQVEQATEGYSLPQGIPVYLYVGRMKWYKGIRIIMDALAALKGQGFDFRMVLVGEGTERGEMEAYAQKLQIEEKCIFTGAIRERELLRAWYTRADLFLFPSTFDTNGLVVREAAACSLPSVLIRGSAAAEGVVHGENGFLMEEHAESLSACLAELSQHPETIKRAGENASRQLYMSWETAVQMAIERYAVVSDQYKSGVYTQRRKAVDAILRANHELVEGLGHLIHLFRPKQ